MASAVDPNPGIKSERHPLDTTCINTILNTSPWTPVQAANSGHPGTPDGHGPRGLLSLAGTCCGLTRPIRSGLAQPRPFRAVGGPRVDAALFALCT